MLIKTVLNRLERFKSFVFGAVTFQVVHGSEALVIEIKARANSKPECPECGKRCKKRDTQPAQLFEYVPFWPYLTFPLEPSQIHPSFDFLSAQIPKMTTK